MFYAKYGFTSNVIDPSQMAAIRDAYVEIKKRDGDYAMASEITKSGEAGLSVRINGTTKNISAMKVLQRFENAHDIDDLFRSRFVSDYQFFETKGKTFLENAARDKAYLIEGSLFE